MTFPSRPGRAGRLFVAWREALLDEVAPTDVIELIWVRDAALLQWELARLERVRSDLLASNSTEVLVALLAPNNRGGEAHKRAKRLAEAFIAGDPNAQAAVAGRLERHGHSVSEIGAEAYVRSLRGMQDVERLIAGARKRRDQLLREVERRRKALATWLRSSAGPTNDQSDRPRGSHALEDQPSTRVSSATSPAVGTVMGSTLPDEHEDERLGRKLAAADDDSRLRRGLDRRQADH